MIRAETGEFLAYAGLKLVLAITAGAVVGFVVAIPALVLLLPFAALGGASFLATGGNAVAGIVAVVVLGGLYLLVLFALIAVVRVPVVTYFRYYGLLRLGDVDADLDLIPDRRAAIRADGSGETGGSDGEWGR